VQHLKGYRFCLLLFMYLECP